MLGLDTAQLGQGIAAVVGALTGVAAFWATRKAGKRAAALAVHTAETDEEVKRTSASAALNRAEVAAWQALIETLTKRFMDATKEVGAVRSELAARDARIEELEGRLRAANARIERLEAAIGGRRASDASGGRASGEGSGE